MRTSLPADTHEVLTRLSAVERGQEAIVSELKGVAQGLSALRLTMVDQASTVDLSDVRCTSASAARLAPTRPRASLSLRPETERRDTGGAAHVPMRKHRSENVRKFATRYRLQPRRVGTSLVR